MSLDVLADLLMSPGVEERVALRGPVGVMALHGGVEEQTAEVASAVAERCDASLYLLMQPRDHRWHVPSSRLHPSESAALDSFVAHVRMAISLHGFGRRHLPDSVLVGGRNSRVAHRVAAELRRATELDVIDTPSDIPEGLRGLHRSNPVNLPECAGVQVELSPGARHEAVVPRIVDALVAVVETEAAPVVVGGSGATR